MPRSLPTRGLPLPLLVSLGLLGGGARLAAQAAGAPPAFDPVGSFRVEIASPPPRGDWSALIAIRRVEGGYEGTFSNPDGPGGYPVTSIAAADSSLTVIMGGEAAGAEFHLTVRGDSLVGVMLSLTNGPTPVRGRRLAR